MAPEIISENLEERELYKSFCTACDLYSFGIIAYNLIFGALPFKVEVEGMFDRKMVWDAWKRSECEEVHPEIISFLKGLL
jgi:serine/threonine protein kinase